MCRSSDYCTELSPDVSRWSQHSPLPPPDWIEPQLEQLIKAIRLYVVGDRRGCLQKLSQTQSSEMRNWYIEHGQVSGRHRARTLARPTPKNVDVSQRDPLRSPKKFEDRVFKRDGFRCRYCGIRLVSPKVLKALIQALDTPEFRRGPRNMDTHGLLCIFYPSADHVVPWNKGGRTDLDNLVTSCVPCNFGKDQFTIEQIGIENPLLRDPILDSWDGLLPLLDEIRSAVGR